METGRAVSYGLAKYILFPLLSLIFAGLWAYLKKQKEELPPKYKKFNEERIKNNYRKQLEQEALRERLKKEVMDEFNKSSNSEN
jgi:Tfp pilus assembly protein PilO